MVMPGGCRLHEREYAVEQRLYLTHTDLERLESLLDTLAPSQNTLRLEEELARAVVVESKDIPPDVVTMNSRVRVFDENEGRELVLTLVYPSQADADAGRISFCSHRSARPCWACRSVNRLTGQCRRVAQKPCRSSKSSINPKHPVISNPEAAPAPGIAPAASQRACSGVVLKFVTRCSVRTHKRPLQSPQRSIRTFYERVNVDGPVKSRPTGPPRADKFRPVSSVFLSVRYPWIPDCATVSQFPFVSSRPKGEIVSVC